MRFLSLAGSLLLVGVAACGSEPEMRTEVAAGSTEPSCERISAFADALVDVGVDYGYQPSLSPSSLATRVDVVFAGRVTGEFAHREAKPEEPVTSWLGFEVEVADVVQGAVTVGDRVFVAVPYNPAHRAADEYEATVVVGTEVVVFADDMPDPPADFFVGVEGFATACAEGGPIGRVGATSAWTEAETLSALLDAAAAPADRVEVMLWHCGIDTITVDNRRWEVPNDEEPFDATNAPESFTGTGMIEQVSTDELRYVDDSGVVLRFLPEDGTEPPCA